MGYTVTAFRIISANGKTTLKNHKKKVVHYSDAMEEYYRLKNLGDYVNIRIVKNEKSLL